MVVCAANEPCRFAHNKNTHDSSESKSLWGWSPNREGGVSARTTGRVRYGDGADRSVQPHGNGRRRPVVAKLQLESGSGGVERSRTGFRIVAFVLLSFNVDARTKRCRFQYGQRRGRSRIAAG